RAADFALFFYFVRSPAQPAQIPPRSFVQQVRVHLRAKDRFREFYLADFLAIQIDDVHDRHVSCPSLALTLRRYHNCPPPQAAPAKPYFAAFTAFLALRIKMYCPLGPGTEPLTNSRLSSSSTFTPFHFFAF